MAYELVEIADERGYIIRDADHPHQSIKIGSLRDLLQLRERVNSYVDTQIPDAVTTEQTAPLTNDLITVAEALQLADEQGIDVPRATMKSAFYRRTIPSAFQQGKRWLAPRREVLLWLDAYNTTP